MFTQCFAKRPLHRFGRLDEKSAPDLDMWKESVTKLSHSFACNRGLNRNVKGRAWVGCSHSEGIFKHISKAYEAIMRI